MQALHAVGLVHRPVNIVGPDPLSAQLPFQLPASDPFQIIQQRVSQRSLALSEIPSLQALRPSCVNGGHRLVHLP